MVYVKRTVKKRAPAKAKRYRRRSTRGRKGYNRIVVTRNPIAKSAIVNLKYCADKLLTTSGAFAVDVPYVFQFKANGMYDPDVALGGHQPLAFDQWMTFYDHFCVLGSKITMTVQSNNSTSSSDPNNWYCGIYLDDDYTIPGSVNLLMEQGGSVYRPVNTYQSFPVTVTKRFSAKKFFSKSKPQDDPELKGSTSGDPTEQAGYTCWVGSPLLTDTATFYLHIVIEYCALLSEPKNLDQS